MTFLEIFLFFFVGFILLKGQVHKLKDGKLIQKRGKIMSK